MSFWDKLFRSKHANGPGARTVSSGDATPPLRPVGHDDGKCPYCSTALTKLPRQKRACEHCGQIIYPRRRPFDGKVALFREGELDQLEEQRAIAYGRYDDYLAERQRRERTRSQLRHKFGGEPSECDIEWAILHDESMRHASTPAFGLYRNTRLNMAHLLEAAGRQADSLDLWLELMCLDLNGVSNMPVLSADELQFHKQVSRELGRSPAHGPFSLEFANPIAAFVWKVIEIAELRGLDRDQLRTLFIRVYERTPGHQLMPLNADATWARLASLLESERTAAHAAIERRRPRMSSRRAKPRSRPQR